jgi:hypothetical protein
VKLFENIPRHRLRVRFASEHVKDKLEKARARERESKQSHGVLETKHDFRFK